MSRRLPVASGDTFGRLTVRREGPPNREGRRWWCECSCGDHCVLVCSSRLHNGSCKSCGCLKRDNLSRRTHGRSKTSEHRAWCHIRQRCENPNDKAWPHYGGRGITVCARWQRFEVFLADMGLKPHPGASIERLDVDGHYEPDNCIWADAQTQARNKTTSFWVTHQGERLHIKDWANRTGISYGTLRRRLLYLKWGVERSLTTPADDYRRRAIYTWRGQTRTLKEWSIATGISVSTLHARLSIAQWPIERALTEPIANKKARQ